MSLFRKRPVGVRADAHLLGLGPTRRGARQTGALDVEHELRMAVALPGGTAFETTHICKVPNAKSPVIGDTLPVVVDPAEQKVTRIVFDEMPDQADRATAPS
jgi:hypothetical protein